jgi:hypothetical protein
MKKCINCGSKLLFKRELMTIFFNLKLRCHHCGLVMKTGIVFDQIIELVAYFILIFSVLGTFTYIGGYSILFGIAVFSFIKLLAYLFFYRLIKV